MITDFALDLSSFYSYGRVTVMSRADPGGRVMGVGLAWAGRLTATDAATATAAYAACVYRRL